MKPIEIKTQLCAIACTVITSMFCTPAAWGGETSTSSVLEREAVFDIAPQPLDSALLQFSQQAKVQVMLAGSGEIGRTKVSAVKGQFVIKQALASLLHDTGFTYTAIDDGTVTIKRIGAAASSLVGSDQMMLAQSTDDPVTGNAKSGASNPASAESTEVSDQDKDPVQEVVVTGTNIRGVPPVGSPLHVIDRQEIERSGYTTAAQLIESLPQNYSGDASEDVINTNQGLQNIGGGTGVNLRGFSSSSTLVLLNGRRMPQAGGQNGGYVDISSIPLSAIGWVEVLADGASAIYGSDAIAGVVNFVLRDDYEGAETNLRYGGAHGGAEEITASQTFGFKWNSGNALVNYEYNKRGNLGREQRWYTRTADLRPYGGDDFRANASNPGTIVFPATAAIPRGQDGTALTDADLLIGQENLSNVFNTGWDILFDNERHNFYGSLKQRVSNSVEMFAEGRYATRKYSFNTGGNTYFFMGVTDANPYFVSPVPGASQIFMNYNFIDDLGVGTSRGDVKDYDGTLGFTWDLPAQWQVEAFGAYSRETHTNVASSIDVSRLNEALGVDDPSTPFNPQLDGYFNPFGEGSNSPRKVLDYIRGGAFYDIEGYVSTANLKADGPLFPLPGGMARLAIGAERRKESYERVGSLIDGGQNRIIGAAGADQQREISAAFAELFIPLVGPDNRRAGVKSLSLSAAARYEDYSDFGSSTNPKFGLEWQVADSFAIRGSWGKSFKAPILENLSPQSQFVYPVDFTNPSSPTGTTYGLFLQNSNPDLTAETSTAWTAGMVIQPAALPGLKLEATYFTIDFDNRIASVPGVFDALLDPQFYAPFITLNPDDALVQQLINSPGFLDYYGTPSAASVDVIIDGRFRNITSTQIQGVDVLLGYRGISALGNYGLNLNANYMLAFDQRVLPTAPTMEVVDKLGYPVDLRVRASGSLERGGMGASLALNYYDSYSTTATPVRRIDSWTTLDTTLWVDLPAVLKGTRLMLSVQNVFDEDPPFVNQSGGYDPANADALGRVLSIQVRHQW